ncbi:NAD(P)-dependent oxidoreductase [Bradyrhizobium sp. 187]|uniref:NAD(P)-dependent oxidoreductase n=1 Tax=Bradyrhizobium sp. 187 TaxID=2782655 RepID=UPI001FFF1D69|nr:NAD(P)-dependent oxidoreductase [Bradyrhizobium sp. 187]UPJ74141.1 NAD(P)-dependent oxidoreductase [Bradyrhizobium sp. 187]
MLDDVERNTNGNPQVDSRMSSKIGFIGLGLMGTAMAANLAADGRNVCAYVRRPERIKDLRALGVAATTRRPDLFDSDIIITMLPDDAAVRDIFFGPLGIAESLRPGAIHLSMSTISSGASAALLFEHERRGQGYVAAPVFGNPDAARARQLAVIVAGKPESCEHCRSLTDSGEDFRHRDGSRTGQSAQVARQHDDCDSSRGPRRNRDCSAQARTGPSAIRGYHDGHNV